MEYNPLSPEVKANPYPYYADLRRSAPVYYVESLDCWAVSRYADVNYVLRTPKLFSSEILFTARHGEMNPVPEALSLDFFRPSGPHAFTEVGQQSVYPQNCEKPPAMDPRDHTCPAGSGRRQDAFDLVEVISSPLPVIVIAEMLGVEPDRQVDFKRWSNDIINAANRTYTPEGKEQIEQSIAEFRAYFEAAIAELRQTPREDLITALVRAEEENQTLTPGEVLSLTVLLLIAGNETTTNLIGNMMLALLSHPDQLAKVQADPTMIPNVVEETLRYDGPVQGIFRQATEKSKSRARRSQPSRSCFPSLRRRIMMRQHSRIRSALILPGPSTVISDSGLGGISVLVRNSPDSKLRSRSKSLLHGLPPFPIDLTRSSTPSRFSCGGSQHCR